ncbi:MAG: DUF2889 domain-containing protein [Thermodesulfobacteriota bacterium]
MTQGLLKGMIQGKTPIHRRDISIATYPLDDFKVVVEGKLNDDRLVPIYRHWDNKPRAVGPVHGLCVRLLVGEYPLRILDAEADMDTVPNPGCPAAAESVKKVIGEKITPGFSDRVREKIGGAAGCTHLTHLVVVMGPAALHGFWTLYAQHPRTAPKSMEEVEGLEYLLNSCHLWTPDGPYVQELREIIRKIGENGSK